jgi:hypothetical protein
MRASINAYPLATVDYIQITFSENKEILSEEVLVFLRLEIPEFYTVIYDKDRFIFSYQPHSYEMPEINIQTYNEFDCLVFGNGSPEILNSDDFNKRYKPL